MVKTLTYLFACAFLAVLRRLGFRNPAIAIDDVEGFANEQPDEDDYYKLQDR